MLDDEPLARELMRRHISKVPDLEIVAECSDALIAMQIIRNQKIDLMFMDIQMPNISGLEFLKILKHPPKVIITTGHREYAIESFELDVVDYLLKPFSFERFIKSVEKYFQSKAEEKQFSNQGDPQKLNQEESFVYLKENKRLIKVCLEDITYIEGLSEYIQVFTKNRKIITKMSLSGLEAMLPPDKFLRIHKSYIVSLANLEAFSANSVEVNRKELPIGRSYKNNVLSSLQFQLSM